MAENQQQEPLHYDVVIVGGGMVGAAMACALGGSKLRVALVEGRIPESFDTSQEHDLRVSALSLASENILRNVGAWEGVVSRRLCPYRHMRVWELAGKGDTHFDSADAGFPRLGHIIENRVIQLALLERVAEFDNIDLFCPQTPSAIHYSAQDIQLRLQDGRILQASLLVGADGGQSRVRQAAGIGVHNWDYDQHCLVASVVTGYDQQSVTWQRFTPTGPQAFLPLTGRHASLVWYQSPREVKRLLGLPEELFLLELGKEFPAELGTIQRVLQRGSFPLRRQHALHYVKPGVALIGDAAHMIHPLAGQGVNIGLLDAAALAELLLDGVAEGRQIGELAFLQDYERSRRQHNGLMMAAMDLFCRVFSNDRKPLKVLRNIGLGLAQHITPAKRQAMLFAMGVSSDLPVLARAKAS